MFWKRKNESKPTESEKIDKNEEIVDSSVSEDAETMEQPSSVEEEKTQDPPPKKGLFAKLKDRLKATRESITQKTMQIFRLRGKIDEDLLEELEEVLIAADVGVETTIYLITELRQRIRREKKSESSDIEWFTSTLQQLMRDILDQGERELTFSSDGPSIFLVIGVNGVGKTTAIGKLAHRFKQEGKKVMLIAADTFRAAAIQQLEIWAKRADTDIVTGKEGADPSSVVFKGIEQERKSNPDVIIIDTAGRLHTKSNLVQELAKMSRVISREHPEAPHETMLVLDASTGQNALNQAKTFMEACGVTGLILTKLDGTARGGVVLAVHKELELPVKFIGVGEGIDDLEVFEPEAFSKALFQTEMQNQSNKS